MRGPRTAKELRLFKDAEESALYNGAVDEFVQKDKWSAEQAEREKPRRESNLNELLAAFHQGKRQGSIEFSRDDQTSKVLSPVLDGHEKARQRRAKLMLELEEAVPAQSSPKSFHLPPAWSEA